MDCVKLCSTRSPWALSIIRADGKKKRDPQECVLVLKSFEQEARTALGVSPATEESPQSPPPPAKATLGDSESEDEVTPKSKASTSPSALVSASEDRPAASPPAKKRKSVSSVGMSKVLLGGQSVRMGVGKGPGLLLYADTENVLNALCYVKENFERLADAGRMEVAEQLRMKRESCGRTPSSDSHESEACGLQPALIAVKGHKDSGKIRFDLKAGGYILHYEGADGKTHRVAAGFVVPRLDPMGKPLDGATYSHAKEFVLQKARRRWNELDCGAAPRYTFA